jgi:hypothetical protein
LVAEEDGEVSADADEDGADVDVDSSAVLGGVAGAEEELGDEVGVGVGVAEGELLGVGVGDGVDVAETETVVTAPCVGVLAAGPGVWSLCRSARTRAEVSAATIARIVTPMRIPAPGERRGGSGGRPTETRS